MKINPGIRSLPINHLIVNLPGETARQEAVEEIQVIIPEVEEEADEMIKMTNRTKINHLGTMWIANRRLKKLEDLAVVTATMEMVVVVEAQGIRTLH